MESQIGFNDPDDFEDQLEKTVDVIIEIAAPLIAARDCGVQEAIERATQYIIAQRDVNNDLTGTIETLEESQYPHPSRQATPAQIAAIAIKIDDDARDAAERII